MNNNIDKNCIDIVKKLQDNGYEAYLVGGCVRDMLMGNTPHDFDITTSATPKEVISIFEKTIPTGINYGTITVMIDNVGYEVTTFRQDQTYSNGRKPDAVTFGKCIKEDLERRDFTINAIAFNPLNNEIVDPFDGIKDIESKILRAVGNPEKRIKEDALRILRGYRFSTKYNLVIDDDTLIAMKNNLYLINQNVSKERINNELIKILENSLDISDLELLWDVFETIFPVLKETKGYDQKNPHHKSTLDKHIIEAMANVSVLEKKNIDCFKNINFAELRLALLLHDIGKIYTQTFDENNIAHYYGHAEYSSKIAKECLKELKFSNSVINNVTNLIEKHQTTFPSTSKNMIKFINKNGIENTYGLLAIYYCDKMSHNTPFDKKMFFDLINTIKGLQLEPMTNFGLKDLAINGNDVIKETNARGKEIGELLNKALEAVLNDEVCNSKKELIKFIKKIK